MKRAVAMTLLLLLGVWFVLARLEKRDDAPQPSIVAAVPAPSQQATSEIPHLPDRVEFYSQVEPIFAAHCVHCHGPERLEAALRLDRRPPAWNAAAQSSDAVAAPPAVELVRRIASDDETIRMPPDEPLAPEQIALLRRWIDEGGYWPGKVAQVAADWPEAQRRHWAFQPLSSPPVPDVERRGWVRNPIDAFILRELEQADLSPAEPAAPGDLARRMILAVTGLPPSLEEVRRFRAATPIEFDRLVDELLARPSYGEHWARYWLDLVRYADTNGYEYDGRKPLVWNYRDFVIHALNEDRPYDEFVRMQLAGDLFEQPTSEDFIASGFLRLGAWDSEPDDALQDRYDQLDDIVSTTGAVFMGLTVGCARCHDHPVEPILAHDYYRLVAVFADLQRPLQGRVEVPTPSATPRELRQAQAAIQEQLRLQRQAFMESDEQKAQSLRHRAARLVSDYQFEQAYRWETVGSAAQPTRLLLRGNPRTPGEPVRPGMPSILARKPFCADSPPRLQLAEALTGEVRSLTARVIVNRIWGWHFGTALVETPGNLGTSGAAASHPQLLEWLAWWFVDRADWSVKQLHRLILTSNTYRMSCRAAEDDAPPRRALLAAFPRRRLRAEVIRDAVQVIAGRQTDEMYGPPVYPEVPEEVLDTLTEPGEWSGALDSGRRTIYAINQRNLPLPLLQEFDFPTQTDSCPQRMTTHTATQALTLWNSAFVERAAQSFAKRIRSEVSSEDPRAQIELAFQLAIGRLPDAVETKTLLEFLRASNRSTSGPNDLDALSRMCLVLFNLNEFVYPE